MCSPTHPTIKPAMIRDEHTEEQKLIENFGEEENIVQTSKKLPIPK
jgi:hypothetical protein